MKKSVKNTLAMPPKLLQETQKQQVEINTLKVAWADAQQRADKLSQEVLLKQASLEAKVVGFAKHHGIDLNNASQGRWIFDIPTGKLSKAE